MRNFGEYNRSFLNLCTQVAEVRGPARGVPGVRAVDARVRPPHCRDEAQEENHRGPVQRGDCAALPPGRQDQRGEDRK